MPPNIVLVHSSDFAYLIGRYYNKDSRSSLAPFQAPPSNGLVVEPTPSEKYARQNGFIFPNFRGENKTYSPQI